MIDQAGRSPTTYDQCELFNEWNDGEPIPGRFTEPPQPLRLGPPKQSPVVDIYE